MKYFFGSFVVNDCESGCSVTAKIECSNHQLLDAVRNNIIDTTIINEMHSHRIPYSNVGSCVRVEILNDEIWIEVKINNDNTRRKVASWTLTGLSIKFDDTSGRIIEFSLIDAPTFQDDEDDWAYEASEIVADINVNLTDSLDILSFEQNLEKHINRPLPPWLLQHALVQAINGIRIIIYPNDHNPPHFHVVGNGIDAKFSIESGAMISGNIKQRHEKIIKTWFQHSKDKLISAWDKTRPTGY